MKFRFVYLSMSLIALGLLAAQVQASVVVDDTFADNNRATGPAQWWSSSSSSNNSVETTVGTTGLVTGSSGRGMHATFAPQNLGIGDSMTITYLFDTPATVTALGSSAALKVALMGGTLAADLNSSSTPPGNPAYIGVPGYFGGFDVNLAVPGDSNVGIRKHDTASLSGRFLGTTGEWISLGSSSMDGYTFTANTGYTGVFKLTRTGADSVDVFSSLSLTSGGLLGSHTETDGSAAVFSNLGTFGIWANSNMFGSSNVIDAANNGITLTRFTVDFTAVPEPGSAALLLGGLVSLGLVRRRK